MGLFLGVGITLVDFKLEFGRLWENDEMRIVLADEISPDNCRLWDLEDQRRRWTRTGSVATWARWKRRIQEVAKRLGILPEAWLPRHEGAGDHAMILRAAARGERDFARRPRAGR